MDATAIIAIYAAVVATAALAIEAAKWRAARTRLKIEVFAGVAPILGGQKDEFGNETTERGEVIFLRLTNCSPHPIKITHVGMVAVGRNDDKGIAFTRPYPLAVPLPFEIPARDNVTIWQPRRGLEKWEGRRIRAVTQTAAGDDFQTPKLRLGDLSRLEIIP